MSTEEASLDKKQSPVTRRRSIKELALQFDKGPPINPEEQKERDRERRESLKRSESATREALHKHHPVADDIYAQELGRDRHVRAQLRAAELYAQQNLQTYSGGRTLQDEVMSKGKMETAKVKRAEMDAKQRLSGYSGSLGASVQNAITDNERRARTAEERRRREREAKMRNTPPGGRSHGQDGAVAAKRAFFSRTGDGGLSSPSSRDRQGSWEGSQDGGGSVRSLADAEEDEIPAMLARLAALGFILTAPKSPVNCGEGGAVDADNGEVSTGAPASEDVSTGIASGDQSTAEQGQGDEQARPQEDISAVLSKKTEEVERLEHTVVELWNENEELRAAHANEVSELRQQLSVLNDCAKGEVDGGEGGEKVGGSSAKNTGVGAEVGAGEESVTESGEQGCDVSTDATGTDAVVDELRGQIVQLEACVEASEASLAAAQSECEAMKAKLAASEATALEARRRGDSAEVAASAVATAAEASAMRAGDEVNRLTEELEAAQKLLSGAFGNLLPRRNVPSTVVVEAINGNGVWFADGASWDDGYDDDDQEEQEAEE